MSNGSPDRKLPMPLKLTDLQRAVLKALQGKETERYPLSNWYLGALYALDNPHNPDHFSQAAHSLRELIEKLPRVVGEMDMPGSFRDIRSNIDARFTKDKERYGKAWTGKKIDCELAKTLGEIDRYLMANQQPTRRERVQSALAKLDPMAEHLDSDIRRRKRDALHTLWQKLEDYAHHQNEPTVEDFNECLTILERTVLELLAPITAQDQQEIRSILDRPVRLESDIERLLLLIERRGTNFVFFFQHVNDAAWIPILNKKSYFAHPPGRINLPFWPPLSYLVRVFDSEPEKVLGILERLPDTDNPRILKRIIDVVLKADSPEVIHRFTSKIMAFVDNAWVNTWMGTDNIIELLKKPYLFEKPLDEKLLEGFASSFLSKVVEFRPDPQSEDKQTWRREGLKDLMTLHFRTSLEPVPRFGRWQYQKILNNGVWPMAEKEPYRVALILIENVANMIPLTMHQEDIDKGSEEDISEAWCQRLDAADHDYEDSRATLVRTLTFACGKVYEKSSESVSDLDKVLRNQRWKVFRRLRQHLYALYPNEQTKPWIRELILKHGDYARWEHHYEFQRMIRRACEHFGEELITEEERTQIFDAIRSGPSETDFREWVGEQFTEDLFRQRERRFHRMQFNPFVSVLFGENATYFQELKDEADDQIAEGDYYPFSEAKGGWVSRQSPRSREDLAKLTDEELLTYMNEWQEEHYDKDNLLVDITIESLAKEFQSVFRDSIIPDTDRLRFWMENREGIERPIYVRVMVEAMQERVKAKDFDKLNEWLSFCEWVLSHSDQEHEDYRHGDAFRENPCWRSSRRAVGDFVETCLKSDVDVPITARDPLAKLLEMLCTQFDWRLDRNKPMLLNQDDQLAEAINNTRSRAMESLVHFGSWLRRHDQGEDISTITTILEKRFSSETDYPLSLPEYAILGSRYGNIFSLNETWATVHKSHFFPQDRLRAWLEAFKNFLRFHRPFKPTFEILREDFDFALEHLQSLRDKEHPNRNPVDILGHHLFTYYLWEAYPLTGEESLLERFYQKTNEYRVLWTNLFDHVGRMFQNSEKHLDHALKERCIQFFNWRFEVGDTTELREFTHWLDAQCLDGGWRLEAYSKILDICISKNVKPFREHEALRFEPLFRMLDNHTAKVVECFAKLTDCVLEHDTYFLEADEAKTILKAGLKSNDENVRNNAERARENLLRRGRFDFLDV